MRDLAVKHGYSPQSVVMYGDLPDVIYEGGVMRRRGPSDPPAVPTPGLDDECFMVVTGAHEGAWSILATVDRNRLYYGSFILPRAFSVQMGVVLGERAVTVEVNGVPVRATFIGQNPHLWSKDLRPVLDRGGLADGQAIRVTKVGYRQLLLEPLPPAPGPARDSFDVIVAGAALQAPDGTVPADEDVISLLAYAVGLDRSAPLPLLARRLRARRNRDLLAALCDIHPEAEGF